MSRKCIYRAGLGLAFILIQSMAVGQDAATDGARETASGSNWMLWGLATSFLFLLFFLLRVATRLNGIDREAAPAGLSFRQWWARMDRRLFTKAVDVEREEDILLDHDYDGIKELDNALPPWWKWGFYVTVVLSLVYLLYYHVLGKGMDPDQEYVAEMKAAERDVEAYRKKAGELVDEKTVTLADARGIEAGRKLYEQKCFMCHGQNGEGGVGPNLTDDYWIHGGSINDVFKTIKYGVLDKGMQSWQSAFSPSEIRNISSYVKSLKGTKPANAKAPQGERFSEADNTPKKDSTAVARN